MSLFCIVMPTLSDQLLNFMQHEEEGKLMVNPAWLIWQWGTVWSRKIP